LEKFESGLARLGLILLDLEKIWPPSIAGHGAIGQNPLAEQAVNN
jgi:hypothetical protein